MEWVLVRTYNFDPEIRVWLFPTEEAAINEMVKQYERDIESERREYADEDREDHGVYEEKCFCNKDIGVASLVWKNDCTWNDPDEFDYCEWRVTRAERKE